MDHTPSLKPIQIMIMTRHDKSTTEHFLYTDTSLLKCNYMYKKI